ncbi:hypothetical protein GCK32_022056, partial [Trichostrongylus colubriformis]
PKQSGQSLEPKSSYECIGPPEQYMKRSSYLAI